MKVFEIYPYWYACEDIDEAIEFHKREMWDSDDLEEIVAKEMNYDEMQELEYHHDFENEDGKKESFDSRLSYLVRSNTDFPVLFAYNLAEM